MLRPFDMSTHVFYCAAAGAAPCTLGYFLNAGRTTRSRVSVV